MATTMRIPIEVVAMAGTLVGFSLAVSLLSRRPRDDARGYFGWFVL